jgi:hypothetical protein
MCENLRHTNSYTTVPSTGDSVSFLSGFVASNILLSTDKETEWKATVPSDVTLV